MLYHLSYASKYVPDRRDKISTTALDVQSQSCRRLPVFAVR
jgi:hypothetical protein